MSAPRLQDLNPEQAHAVSALLDEGLRIAPADRAHWQQQLSQKEPQLSQLVTRLLAEMGEMSPATRDDSFIRAIGSAAEQATRGDDLAEGEQLGPYRLVRVLGQGGMGSVWLAERADGLFQRRVALKLPHRSLINPAARERFGIDHAARERFGIDHAARERFARERDILARLSHPQIARLLDAGFSPSGHPFLALEYVEGKTLSVHCDEQRLSLAGRLELMQQVLGAVQYAHQNLVIHRDLKPGNILVTPRGQVRLLDFGISKLMSDSQVQDSDLTQLAGPVLTPDYAAPEHVAGLPVSTASDVYSLGVVLYTLLCGRRPFTTVNGQRRYALPLRPSQQQLDEAIAAARSTTPKKLARALSGDLDTIVLKALKDDPSERYPTAEAFHEDIARYLAGEPVKARPDSLTYRAWKFVRRQRLPLGVSAVVVLLLLAATYISLDQARQARSAARAATQQAQRARAVQDFLLGVFLANTDQQADPRTARTRTARELLDIGSQRVASQLSATPDVLADMCETLADMYHQMGLGADAARLRRQRIAALQTVHGKDHELVAEALLLLAKDQRQAGDIAPALQTIDEAKRMLDRMGDHSSQTRAFTWLAAAELEQSTSIERMREDAERARAYFTTHTVERMWSNRFMSVELAARAQQLRGDIEAAEAGYVASLHELEQLGQHPSAWSVTPLVWLAETQWQASRFDAAEMNLREALALSLFYNGAENGSTLQTQTKLGALLHETGKTEEGLRLLADVASKLDGANVNVLSTWRSMYGSVLMSRGRIQEAERLFSELVDELSQSLPESLHMARALMLHANATRLLGRDVQSAADSARALQLFARVAGAAVLPRAYVPLYNTRARSQLAQADVTGAQQTLRLVVSDDVETADAVETQLIRARISQRQASWAEAQRSAQAALALLRTPQLLGRLPRMEAEALFVLGAARLQMDAREAGCADLAQAASLRAMYGEPASVYADEVAHARESCLPL